MSGQVVGYVRVSAADQNPQRQIEVLGECHKIFTDKISGKSRAKRKALADLLEYIRDDDTVRIASMDRLGRDTRDLYNIVAEITDKGAAVEFVNENITVDKNGASVAATAGQYIKKVVLELGGNDPFVVLDRDILPKAVKGALYGRMANAGQACNAAKRIIVLEEYYDEFVDELSKAVNKLQLADPAEEDTFIGPMSSASAAEGLHEQVQDAISQGATVHAGGDFDARGGAWYQPTMLTGITPQMRAYTEELFGPVAMVYKVKDDNEAIKMANDTPYGLSAAVMASDAEHARRVGEHIETGMVYINEPAATSAELPFGGYKRSGIGRELGRYGMEEFVNKRLMKFAG